MKIKAEIQYPIIIEKEFEKEFGIEKLTEYLVRRKQYYEESFTKEDLEDFISDFSYDMYYNLGEEIISKDYDINQIDGGQINTNILNIDELVEYYSYLITE